MKSVVLIETDLGSRWSEIQTAEDDVHRCMTLVDRAGWIKTDTFFNDADIFYR